MNSKITIRISSLLLLLLMLVFGGLNVWGQTGIWYIASDIDSYKNENTHYSSSGSTANHCYLVPAKGESLENKELAYYKYADYGFECPYLTTYRTNRDNNSIWILKKKESSYQIIHALTGKYVEYAIPDTDKPTRRVVHLVEQSDTQASSNSNTLFSITGTTGILIVPNALSSATIKYLNVCTHNYEKYYADASKDNSGGIIGVWSGTTDLSLWHLEEATLDEPTISEVNPETNRVTITGPDWLPEGYNIRYTVSTDGTPPADPDASSPILENPSSVGYEVSETCIIKAVVERYDVILSEVATSGTLVPARCITPVISYSTETGEVTLSSETGGASIYYTIDGETPNILYGEPFSVTDQQTVKAKAIKTGILDSEIASSKLVLNPTITLAATEYTYSGSAIMPTVSSVEDGATPIDEEEYTISYKDNTDAGTATVKITDNEGGSYMVYGSTTFTIVPAGVTLTANSGTETYDGTEKTVTGFTSSVDGLTFEGVTANGSGTNAGEYDVTFTGVTINTTMDASGNYVVTGTTKGTLTISPRPLTITAKPVTITYGNEPTNDGVTYSGFAPGEDRSVLSGTLAYAYNYEQFGDVGSYTITPSGLTGANYNISFVAGTLTVNPREVGLVWSETTSFPYDGASHCLTATATGMVNGDVITVNVTGAQTDAGVHTATASLTGDKAGNYKLPDANTCEFSITKVGLTITANSNTITYGDAPAGNGVTYEGFIEGDDENKLGGSLAYDYSYTQFGDVGNTYTITPKGLTSDNYDISFVAGTLTVGQKEVGITWDETTSFPYDGSFHAPTATATATSLVNGDVVTVIVTGANMNAGNHTAVASALEGDKAGNYKLPELPEVITQAFTITPKSIGDGTTLADGYSIDFGEGNTILLTDEVIGRTLVISTDYTVGADTDPSDKYAKRIVTGINNYTGSFEVRNVVISFNTDTDQEEWSATFAAENADGYNIGIGLALPEGVSAYIISDIRGEWAIPEPLNYIPAGVPVLLVAHKKVNGFVVTKAESGDVTPITDDQIARNMLEEVTADTPGYDPSTESAYFATKQIYILYKNEFVFNKAGNMKKGKVYLNPNHTTTSTDTPPARLLIGWNDTTGMEDVKWKMEDGRSERWYTIDGRRLSGKPNAKGIYIVGGKKIVVK